MRKQTSAKVALVIAVTIMAVLPIAGTAQAADAAVPVVAAAAPAALPAATPDREVPSGWNWTNYGPELMSVSCSAPNTCVSVGQGGAVLRSIDDDLRLAWTFVDLKKDPKFPANPVDLVGVTCSDTSCLAVSSPLSPTATYGSWVYRTTDVGLTWTPTQQLPLIGTRKTNIGSSITCAPDAAATADTRVCYIAGTAGGIWRSADDGRTWTGIALPATAPATASFSAVACATPATCVAAGGDTTPSSALISGASVSMLKTPVGIDKLFAALACDSPTRCVATGGIGKYTVMNIDADPNWGMPHVFRKDPKQALIAVKALSCPVENSCVGLDLDGDALRTDALGDPNTFWRMQPAPGIISAIDCVTTNCIGVGKAAAWYESFSLGSGFQRVNEVAGFDLGVCSTTLDSACIAGGKENLGRSVNGGTLWTLPIADHGALNTKAIECSTSLSCIVYGQTDALATDDMNAWRPLWGPVQSAAGSDAIYCVTKTLCVGASTSVVYTTFDGGLTRWNSNQFPKVRPSGISCLPGKTNPVTCFVASKYNILIGTMTQDAQGLPHWNWGYTNADADEEIVAIDCSPDAQQCAAAGKAGEVLTTQNNDLSNSWAAQTLPLGVPIGSLPDYTSVSCPSLNFCMVGGKQGVQSIVTSTLDNFATYSYDKIGDIRAMPGVAGFACESINRCIAVGSTVLLGIRTPPVPVPPTPPTP